MYDWLIVGAGFAGSVLAERLASVRDESVLLIDRRPHIGGNAYDRRNDSGLLIHQYGPHIFHTNSSKVADYLSRFTEWRSYEHRVLAFVDGMLVPIPINLDTVNKLYGLKLSSDELQSWLAARAEPIDGIRTSEDVVVSTVGRELYERRLSPGRSIAMGAAGIGVIALIAARSILGAGNPDDRRSPGDTAQTRRVPPHRPRWNTR